MNSWWIGLTEVERLPWDVSVFVPFFSGEMFFCCLLAPEKRVKKKKMKIFAWHMVKKMNGFWVVPARALAFRSGKACIMGWHLFLFLTFSRDFSLVLKIWCKVKCRVYCKVHKYIRRRPKTFEKITQIVLNLLSNVKYNLKILPNFCGLLRIYNFKHSVDLFIKGKTKEVSTHCDQHSLATFSPYEY